MLTDNKANGIWSAVAEKSTGLRQDEFIGEFARAIESAVIAGQKPRNIHVDTLAAIIREADGRHSLGAGALAEKIVDALRDADQRGKWQDEAERLTVESADLEAERDALQAKVAELESELERERIRLAACGVVALANTQDSAAKQREMLPEYRSGSLDSVERAVDAEMQLLDKVAELEEKSKKLAVSWINENALVTALKDALELALTKTFHQSALIKKCETALILHEKLTRPIHSTTVALAAITTHRSQS